MRKLQSNIGTLGNVIVRQGNQLIVRVEVLRSLRALSKSKSAYSALRSYASELALALRSGDWQRSCSTWLSSISDMARIRTIECFATAITALKYVAVVKHDPQRHMIMCHCTAA